MGSLRDMWRVGAWRWPLTLFCALLAGSVLWCAPAVAFSQRGHVFGFSFKGTGEAKLSDPLGVAVNDATGDVYVADHGKKRVVQLEPVNGKGELSGEQFVRAFGVKTDPTTIAVDDCTDGEGKTCTAAEDPSAGDVYVVGGKAADVIYKFNAEGVLQGTIEKFDGVSFATVEGVAVDSTGSLLVWQADGVIDRFSDATVNEGAESLETGLSGAPGFAVDGEGDFFVGVEGGRVAKLEGLTGLALGEVEVAGEADAVAVNTLDVASNEVDEQGDVYVDSVTPTESGKVTAVDQFAAGEGGLVQALEAPGLVEGGGVAVDQQNGAVFVTDAATGELDVFALEAPGRPTIEDLQALGATTASPYARVLSAQVNPAGSPTRYHFEYGPQKCSSSNGACTITPGKELDEGFAGFASREASQEVGGLEPGTYHYRIVGENGFGEVYGPERIFTILGAVLAGLPDGRAWEMVSPPDKHGAPIESLTREGGQILAAEDGDAFAFVANGAIEEEVQGNRSFEPQQALAIRGAQGWSSQDIATPQDRGAGANFDAPEYQLFSPELALALVEPYVAEPPLARGVSGKTVYLRDDQPIAPGPAEQGSYAEAQANSEFLAPGFLPVAAPSFLDATPDLANVVLDLSAGSSGAGLYEWSAGGGLRFVSEFPGGGSPGANVALGYLHTRAGAISDDGSRVVWTASQSGPGHLYMRDLATGMTVQLDAAQQGLGEPVGATRFQTASGDGSRVFFTDDEPLVKEAEGSVEPGRKISDLYKCEMVEVGGRLSCVLEDLTIPVHVGEEGAVQGDVLGSGEDGSRVFVVARGVLAGNENASGETARSGQDNLYELHREGSVWVRTFIAVLSSEDSPDWDVGANVSAENNAFQTARVSPNGEYLAFMSDRSLTGYDNEDVSSKRSGERLDEEAYLYDTRTQGLTCVSCDPTGERPVGVFDQEHSGEGIGLVVDRRESWRGQWLAGSIPGWTSESPTNALYQSRYLSNEGRLFFDSADPLVPGIAEEDRTRPENVNGQVRMVGVENVYEYEPAGVGGCAASATGGCVALLSSGTSSKESAFLEATPSGNDVFLLTAAQLSPQDTDDAFDIYDARVCTVESPCLAPPQGSPSSCGTLEACHSASLPGPGAIGAPGTATFSGPGNLASPAAKQEVKGITKSVKPLTRAQKLRRALLACSKRYRHSKRKRVACQAHARKLYRPASKARKRAGAKRPAATRAGGGGR